MVNVLVLIVCELSVFAPDGGKLHSHIWVALIGRVSQIGFKRTQGDAADVAEVGPPRRRMRIEHGVELDCNCIYRWTAGTNVFRNVWPHHRHWHGQHCFRLGMALSWHRQVDGVVRRQRRADFGQLLHSRDDWTQAMVMRRRRSAEGSYQHTGGERAQTGHRMMGDGTGPEWVVAERERRDYIYTEIRVLIVELSVCWKDVFLCVFSFKFSEFSWKYSDLIATGNQPSMDTLSPSVKATKRSTLGDCSVRVFKPPKGMDYFKCVCSKAKTQIHNS